MPLEPSPASARIAHTVRLPEALNDAIKSTGEPFSTWIREAADQRARREIPGYDQENQGN